MDRLSQSVDVLGQAMAMQIIPGGPAVTQNSQYFQITATSSTMREDGASTWALGAERTSDVTGFVPLADNAAAALFAYNADLSTECIGLKGWACKDDVNPDDVLRISSYVFTRATYIEGGVDYINPLPYAAYTDPHVFGGLAGLTATYINASGFDLQIAAMSSISVADDLILDVQAGIRRQQQHVERFLYASRLPLAAPLLDFMDYALPAGFEVAPARYCSPRHRMLFISINYGSNACR
jgi:hypothetical protein